MGRKKTHEEYVTQVAEVNSNIEIIEHYVGARTPILHRCKIDGYVWNATPDSILQGHGCPMCAGNARYTTKTFIEAMKNVNPNIEMIGEYTNSKTPILCRCKIDGYIFNSTPDNLLRGHGCPKCAGVKRRTHEEYVEEVAKINPNIIVVGRFINTSTPIEHACKIDGYHWFATPSSILAGSGCPKCGGSMKMTHEEYVSAVDNINPDIEVIDEYINAQTPIKHRCKKDGCVWAAKPNHILSFHGCPVCSSSIGERKVRMYLNLHNINFIPQHTFDRCKYINKLEFDFYLPDYNVCIEYDGRQHYESVDIFGRDLEFEKNQIRDQIKNDYCKNNGIQLLRIRYDEDIYGKLDEFLKSL